jgi:hypothetical protein
MKWDHFLLLTLLEIIVSYCIFLQVKTKFHGIERRCCIMYFILHFVCAGQLYCCWWRCSKASGKNFMKALCIKNEIKTDTLLV